MKAAWILPVVELALFARITAATNTPLLPYDPKTTTDCADWYNNDSNQSCEWVRSYFRITAQEFSAWNPSVAQNCTPFYNWNSYCIITKTKYNQTFPSTTKNSTTTATSTTVTTLGPSPTSWSNMGCYVEDPKKPIMDINTTPSNDTANSVPKCWQTCYRRSYQFAGLKSGNQCWCGTYIGGEWAKNQTDCKTPCTGNTNTTCGGPGLLQIYKALVNVNSSTAAVSTTAATTKATTTPSSGVKRDVAGVPLLNMFW